MKHMRYEFSKPEKKIVRQVIETGLQRDFESSILDIDQIIQQWKSKKLDNWEAYHEIFGKVKQTTSILPGCMMIFADQRT